MIAALLVLVLLLTLAVSAFCSGTERASPECTKQGRSFMSSMPS